MGTRHSGNAHAGLAGLLDAVWTAPSGAPPRVSTGRSVGADGGADEFLCLPSRSRPRLLVPVAGVRRATSVTAANLALRPLRQRVERTLLSVALATGAPQRALGASRVGISVADDRTPPLLEALRQGWRDDVAGIGIAVREVTPNYKPSLVAVDAGGRVIGYAKIGWNDGTRARLTVESETLTRVAGMTSVGVQAPEVEADLSWNGRRVVVVRPLPSAARAYPRRVAAPLALVRAGLAAPERPSVDAAGLASQLVAAVDRHADEQLCAAVRSFGDQVTARHHGCVLPGGLRHGDWVPWNLGTVSGALWAWDWEYADDGSTPMLDIAHWHLQVARFVEGHAISAAFAGLRERLASNLAAVGTEAGTVDALHDLAVLDLAARQSSLAADTGIWRKGVRAGLFEMLGGPQPGS